MFERNGPAVSALAKMLPLILLLVMVRCSKDQDPPLDDSVVCDPQVNNFCDKRFDEMTFVTTHNAYNYADGPINYNGPNQDYPVDRQLDDGVRGFMLDVYYFPGPDSLTEPPSVYHAFPLFGFEPLPGILQLLSEFLEENPQEVLSIIFESYVPFEKIRESFELAGLEQYVYSKSAGDDWPTIGEMIESNQRLVVFTEREGTDGAPWYHYVWDHSTETHFDIDSREQFDCNFNRGEPDNDLFILNHFITSGVSGVGLFDSAVQINTFEYLYERARNCEISTGKTVNFLAIDFYAQGEVFAVADSLNAD